MKGSLEKAETELNSAILLCEFMGEGYECDPNSWESLMQAMDKIESIRDSSQGGFVSTIGKNFCIIQSTKFRPNENTKNAYYNDSYGKDKKSAVHKATLAFVNWYNINIKGD